VTSDNLNCEHLFERLPWDWFRGRTLKRQWRCVRCGLTTRAYDSVDRMALRPVHPHMTVAVRGFNTVQR
jgi:hypothetical protein